MFFFDTEAEEREKKGTHSFDKLSAIPKLKSVNGDSSHKCEPVSVTFPADNHEGTLS